MQLGMGVSVRLPQGKGAFVCQITRVLSHPTFARKIAAFERKEPGLIACTMNPARRSGGLVLGEKPMRGDCGALIAGGQPLQPLVATFTSSSWPTPGKGGAGWD